MTRIEPKPSSSQAARPGPGPQPSAEAAPGPARPAASAPASPLEGLVHGVQDAFSDLDSAVDQAGGGLQNVLTSAEGQLERFTDIRSARSGRRSLVEDLASAAGDTLIGSLAAVMSASAPALGLDSLGALAEVHRQLDIPLRDVHHFFERLLGARPTHEGRYDARSERWTNWNGEATGNVERKNFHQPATAAEVQSTVQRLLDQATVQQQKDGFLRVVGGGHSFNDSTLTGQSMLSLDRLNRVSTVTQSDAAALAAALPAEHRARLEARPGTLVHVEAGTRLRDLTAQLKTMGLSLPVQGSTDAQAIGGLIASDVHGTGFRHGFLSEQIYQLDILEKDGKVHSYRPGDPGFHHAIGGLGETGIVLGAVLKAEPAFNLEKKVHYMDRTRAESQIQGWMADPRSAPYDHVSFYYAGGVDPKEIQTVRMNTWKRTDASPEACSELQKQQAELMDHIGAAFHPEALDRISKLPSDDLLVRALDAASPAIALPSHEAFGRQLFYQHDEIELAVPLENHKAALDEILTLMHAKNFPSVVEVRFTPPGLSQSTLGPGASDKPMSFIELATPLSHKDRIPEVYPEVEKILLKYGAQPHLGKKIYLSPDRYAELSPAYRAKLDAFRDFRNEKGGPFSNAFTNGLFGNIG